MHGLDTSYLSIDLSNSKVKSDAFNGASINYLMLSNAAYATLEDNALCGFTPANIEFPDIATSSDAMTIMSSATNANRLGIADLVQVELSNESLYFYGGTWNSIPSFLSIEGDVLYGIDTNYPYFS